MVPKEPEYPDIEVELIGHDGNVFAILGKVRRALERAGYVGAAEMFFEEATSGDYDHLIATTMRYVSIQ